MSLDFVSAGPDSEYAHMSSRPILFDLDETVYPFLATYERWLAWRHPGKTVDMEAFVWFYDIDAYMSDYLDFQEAFVKDLPSLNVEPIAEGLKGLTQLAATYPLYGCTARNRTDWEGVTEPWLKEWFPFVDDLIYAREERGMPARRKADIAVELDAFALIDDTASWMEDLPAYIKGYVVDRPKPLANDVGSVPWSWIVGDILNEFPIQ